MRPRATPAVKDIDRRFQEAVALHQRGEIAAAAAIYEQLIRSVPDHPELLHLHGTALAQLGRAAAALPALERSLVLRPDHAPTLDVAGAAYLMAGDTVRAVAALTKAQTLTPASDVIARRLGEAYLAAGQNTAARDAFTKALAITPHHPDAQVGLATALSFLGQRAEAIAQLQACVAAHPMVMRAHMVLGTLLGQEGRFAEAEACARAALQLKPAAADGHLLLARALARQGRLEDAHGAYRATFAHGLRDLSALTECGEVLINLDRADEAESVLREAVAADPTAANALTALGRVAELRGDLDNALALHERALAGDPNAANAYVNRGTAQRLKGNFDGALIDFDRALALKPGMPAAIANRGSTLLSLGRLREGWSDFRSRIRAEDGQKDYSGSTPWDGSPLDGKRVLVWTEYGLGDEIMAASLLPDLLARTAHCTVLCSPRMISLFQRAFPEATIIAHEAHITGAFDARLPLMDTAQWLRPNLDAFPARQSFLHADQDKTARLRRRYGADTHRLVGISWRSTSVSSGRHKSLPLTAWAPILKTPGVRFVALQYGDCADDVETARALSGADIVIDTTVDPIGDLESFAAQVSAMDLVISASNTTVHFAGALGKPAWVMVPEGPGAHWYWFQGRDDSPWYPTLRLFRQARPGDWSGATASIAGHLRETAPLRPADT